ncbi:MAG: box helicase domain protein, partial [Conexibacter sp.]|nr:box helicase domain protein [Conexibacter sp.]
PAAEAPAPTTARKRTARVRTTDADADTAVVAATNGAPNENGAGPATKGDRGRARRVAEGTTAKLVVAGGRVDGIEPKDLIQAITKATGLDGTAIRNVRVLDRFAFVDVPADDAARVVATVDGTNVDGHVLRLEPVRA